MKSLETFLINFPFVKFNVFEPFAKHSNEARCEPLTPTKLNHQKILLLHHR